MSEASTSEAKSFKVVLLGEGAVGKTSLVLRYIDNKFNTRHHQTLQDTAGQERFHALGPIYYRDSQGAVLVYDITDRESFNKVKNWVKELRRILGESVILVVVGNKSDLDKDKNVPDEEATEYAESVGATYHLTSAKSNQGIEEMFLALTKRMLAASNEANRNGGGGDDNRRGASGRRNILIQNDDDSSSRGANKKCC